MIKLSNYSLFYTRHMKDMVPGTKVCPISKPTSVGMIVKVSRASDYSYRGPRVDVVWGTGKKRGTKTTHAAKDLVHLDCYLTAVKQKIAALEALTAEADTLGK